MKCRNLNTYIEGFTFLIAGRRISGSVTFNGGLTVQDGLIDGVSISRILNNAITLDTNRISNQIIFDGFVQVSTVQFFIVTKWLC